MRHRVAYRKLGRVTEHRISMLRNQASALLQHERIQTTVPRAKELRPFVERIITHRQAQPGRAGGQLARRHGAPARCSRDIADREVVTKLFDDIAPRYVERPGGYTRLLRLGHRRGDSAEVAEVELLGQRIRPERGGEGRKGCRRRRRQAEEEDRGWPHPRSDWAAARSRPGPDGGKGKVDKAAKGAGQEDHDAAEGRRI